MVLEPIYPAFVMGYDVEIKSFYRGLIVRVHGFSQHTPVICFCHFTTFFIHPVILIFPILPPKTIKYFDIVHVQKNEHSCSEPIYKIACKISQMRFKNLANSFVKIAVSHDGHNKVHKKLSDTSQTKNIRRYENGTAADVPNIYQ